MPEEFSLEKLLENGLPSSANMKDIETIDTYLQHAVKWSENVDKLLTMLDKFGLVDIAKKVAYKKMALEDVKDGSIFPKTEAHKTLFTYLNSLDTGKMAEVIQKLTPEKQPEKHE